MGNLLFITEGMEVAKVPLDKRDESVRNLAILISTAYAERDCCSLEQDIATHQFFFGKFYTDFIYADWGRFCQNEAFKNISQKTYQLLINSCTQCPLLGNQTTIETFEKLGEPSSKAGLSIPSLKVTEPYVSTQMEWKGYKINYYQHNQSEIDWKLSDDDFLPFRTFSDNILLNEIGKYHKEADLETEYKKLTASCSKVVGSNKTSNLIYSNAIANTFHDKIMKKKDERALIAYTKEIGQKICFANAYIYDEELSRREHFASDGTRIIYKIKNKNKEWQYISLDTRHGMFEYHNKLGDHLGEYRFNGTLNSAAEPDHGLKTLS